MKYLYLSIQRYRIKELAKYGEKEKNKQKINFFKKMSFPNIPLQLQEEIIFPKELKWFRYEEVASLNVIRKRKICDFEKSDTVSFSEN